MYFIILFNLDYPNNSLLGKLYLLSIGVKYFFIKTKSYFFFFSLLQHLQKIKPDVESQGDVSKVPLFMITSFLYAIDLDCMNNTQEISGGNLNY